VRDLLQTTTLIKNSCSADGPPKFVFGHYILPHAPYTFNREGEVIPSEPGDPFDKKTNRLEAYFEQVLYANKIIAELVSHIKKNNKKNTIIMIMGDHGYRDDTDQSQTDAAFYNFNAVYFPDGNYQHMNDSLTSVNTFRTVLNVGFNTKLPILKDSFFRMLQTTSAY
jgi:phosphoglycerol transferase MdoB-like AlkP superfamily enzyme